MSENTTATVETAAAPKAAKAKATKKPAKAAKAAPSANGISKPQARILQVLAKSKSPLDRSAIAAKAKVAATWVGGHLLKACAANRGPALAERGLAREVTIDVDGKKERLYEATAKGRQLAAKG